MNSGAGNAPEGVSEMFYRLGILAASLGLFAGLAWGQASVNESLETTTLYVDGVTGLNGNPGTRDLPFLTIQAAMNAAVKNNQNGIGTKIIVNPGTYRENLILVRDPADTSLPITLEAATKGAVTMSGADVWTDWQPFAENAAIYTLPWPYKWGLCATDAAQPPAAPGMVRRREMIFMNGEPLTQAPALDQMTFPGSFFVDETGGTVYLWPPAGARMDTATVEVAIRNKEITLDGKVNLVVRGLTIGFTTSCHTLGESAPAASQNSANILFDRDALVGNGDAGLSIENPVAYVSVALFGRGTSLHPPSGLSVVVN